MAQCHDGDGNDDADDAHPRNYRMDPIKFNEACAFTVRCPGP